MDAVPTEEEIIKESEETREEEEDEAPAGGADKEEKENDPDDATYDPNADKDDGYDRDSVPPMGSEEDSLDDESDDEGIPRTQRRPVARSRGGKAIQRPDRLNLLGAGKMPGLGGGMNKAGKMP